MFRNTCRLWVLLFAGLIALGGTGSGVSISLAAEPEPRPALIIPAQDGLEGRRLFVAKGCVLCHAVNGVGGKAGPALDAPAAGGAIDLLGFVARMWRGAAAMLELQKSGLGYQIELTPQEFADLATFAGSPAAQDSFSIDEVPEHLHPWMLEEPHWEEQNWPDRFLNPQKLFGDGIF